MPLSADFTPPAPARGDGDGGEAFFGARWAVRLCLALLFFFALTVASRYLFPAPPSEVETIIQQPISPEVSAAATRAASEVTAPDPDDPSPSPGQP